MQQFTDKWAVVTGSTHGIGRAIAVALAEAGANLVIHGRDRAAADEVAHAIERHGVASAVAIVDLAEVGGCAKLMDAACDGRTPDVWVNNAGVDVLTGRAAEWSFDEKLAALWQVDVRATIVLSREIGRRMQQRGSGAIVNISWDQSETGMAGESGEMFAATKGAVTAFTRSLAKSLAPEVRANVVAPGWIRTAWGDQASNYWQQRAAEESLLGRWGRPDDVAAAVRWLGSPAAAFITGQVVNVNGGRA